MLIRSARNSIPNKSLFIFTNFPLIIFFTALTLIYFAEKYKSPTLSFYLIPWTSISANNEANLSQVSNK